MVSLWSAPLEIGHAATHHGALIVHQVAAVEVVRNHVSQSVIAFKLTRLRRPAQFFTGLPTVAAIKDLSLKKNHRLPPPLLVDVFFQEVDGKERTMVFITNNLKWSGGSVCDLYKARWEIEVFFKQVKQTLRLSGFLGYSANAIRWQVWTALLVYVLLRFAAHLSQWGHSFTRLFAVVRAALWERLDTLGLLRSYGTAGGPFKLLGAAQSAWLPGFAPILT